MADKKKGSSSKKTASKTYTKKKKGQIKVDRAEMLRWAVGFLAFFIILTFIPAINSGPVGGKIAEVLKGLFGPMYYVTPFLMLAIVISWGRDHANNVAKIKYLLYFLEFSFISILVQIIAAGDTAMTFNQLYGYGITLQSAGAISGSIALAFTMTIGKVASIALAVLGIFICTVLLCGKTPKGTIMAIINFFRRKIEQSREERRAREEEEYDEDEEEEEYIAPPKPVKEPKVKKAKEKPFVAALPPDPVEPEPKPEPEPEPEPFVDELFDAPAPVSAVQPTPPIEPVLTEEPEITEEPDSPALEDFDEEELCLEPIEDTPYVFPSIDLLAKVDSGSSRPTAADAERTSRRLEEILESFNVKAKVVDYTFGPTVTRYELRPETGVKVKSIMNLSEDLTLHLAATSIRIENIPGKAAVGIEIPNKNVAMVGLRALIENPTFQEAKSRLFTALGEDVAGEPVYLDIDKMPHLLIAGATGQGKSVCINSIIVSLLYRNHPNDVKLILIDPKTVEFSFYKDIPHLLVPVINDAKSAAGTLNWACTEMEKRYQLMQEVGAQKLSEYNATIADDPERQRLPQIVIFIDEFADLMMMAPDDVETSVCRLAQKARAAGMHLVIGTQRPSVDVITGLIKANIPSRIALTTFAAVDSRTILDQTGAEKLLGRGDMLYFPVGANKPIRVQGAFVDGKREVAAVTQFIKEAAMAQYDESIMKQIEQEAKLCGMKGKKAAAEAEPDDGSEKLDPMFMDALECAIDCGTVSTSLLQRRLSLGYARAARIIDRMERRGYIGEFDAATKKRNILITREQFAELKLNGETKKEDDNE